MRCSPVSASPNVISTIGSTSSAALPMSPTYSSRPSISSSTIRRLAELLVDELHALREARVVFHDGRLRDAHGRVLEQRLDDQREAQLRRTDGLLAGVTLGERRHANPVVRKDLLGERLVTRHEQR